MKILIADHDGSERRVLRAALADEGHELLTAACCAEALRRFEGERPELVLMDIALRRGGGYECTQRIAAACGSRFVPVMLMASAGEHLSLERFIASGAADFVEGAADIVALKAKVAGYRRLREMYLELERFQYRFRQEVRMAREMFDSINGRSPGDVECVRQWTVSAGHFSGDLLIHERTAAGDLHLLLGDFTGHGLAAALGTLPTADAFFEMTRKGFGIGDIAWEINRKLHEMLPTGHFCAATLVRLAMARGEMEIWNGGQPPLLMLDAAGRLAQEVPSFGMPLGIAEAGRFSRRTMVCDLAGIRHVVLCSDGLLEARNAAGEMFGTDGLLGAVAAAGGRREHLLRTIKSRLIRFLDGMVPHDDVSLLTVDLAGA